MKVFAPALVLFLAAAGCLASEKALLTDRDGWGDLARFAKPTPQCLGGSVEELKERMGVVGPYTLERLKELEAGVAAENDTSGPETSVVWLYPVSSFIKESLESSDQLYTFEFITDPSKSPWWGFRGVLVAHDGCIIHAEVTSYDHG